MIRATEPLIQALRDENNSVHISVAAALGEIDDVRAVESLIQALKDEDASVRNFVAFALSKIKEKNGLA